MKIYKLSLSTLLLFLVLLASGCQSENRSTTKKTPLTIKVKSAIAQPSFQGNLLQFSASIRPKEQATLSTKLMAQIQKVLVEEGEWVKKGQLLVRLDNQDLLAKKAQAEANVKIATSMLKQRTKDFQRTSRLHKKKSASQKELDDITTAYQAAQAQKTMADKQVSEITQFLTYGKLKAPFDGVITRKFMNEGDFASPAMPIIALEGNDSFKVVAWVPEKELSLFQEGKKVQIFVKTLGKKIPAKVHQINISNQFSGAQYEVTALLEAPEKTLRSGMHAYLQVPQEQQQLLVVPTKALFKRGQLTGLYVINSKKKAKLRWVRTGKQTKNGIQILSGLRAGEKYVVQAQGRMEDGVYVQ